MKIKPAHLFGSVALLTAATFAKADRPAYTDGQLRDLYAEGIRYSNAVEFPQLISGADVNTGRHQFGVRDDDLTIDNTLGGEFVGDSVIAGHVEANGRVCASCHRPEFFFKLPPTPLTDHVDPSDPLITGIPADAQGDPRAYDLFVNMGLMKGRPGRFNPLAPESDPYRQLVVWRKTQTVVNMAFAFGLLTDGRARHGIEQARGAAMQHGRADSLSDARIDDLVNPAMPNVAQYQETEIRPPILRALIDNTSPDHQRLLTDPFATVTVTTKAQQEGELVFAQSCMGCHNMPNTFNNVDHVVGGAPANFPPLYGHTFDVGVAQANLRHLDFRAYDNTNGTFFDVTLPLAKLDGTTVSWKVVDDPGAAGATGRYEDLHRFRVPGLRNLSHLAPYFHDDSVPTLEGVVDYFNSPQYNDSTDGRNYPIHLTDHDKAALLEFLRIL